MGWAGVKVADWIACGLGRLGANTMAGMLGREDGMRWVGRAGFSVRWVDTSFRPCSVQPC